MLTDPALLGRERISLLKVVKRRFEILHHCSLKSKVSPVFKTRLQLLFAQEHCSQIMGEKLNVSNISA